MRGAFDLWSASRADRQVSRDCQRSLAENSPEADDDPGFKKGGPGDDFALGYPMTAKKKAAVRRARKKARCARSAAQTESVAGAPAPFAVTDPAHGENSPQAQEDGTTPPRWEPWAPPSEPSVLDEFRALSGLSRDARSFLPSPVSPGDRSLPQDLGPGILDPGSDDNG